MDQGYDERHAHQTTARRPDALDALVPGQSTRSADLRKPGCAATSGLVRFAPPKVGVATTAVNLRAAPRTGPCSAALHLIPQRSVMSVHSELQSTDRENPQWLGVEIDNRRGFVAASLVKIENPPSEARDPASDGAAPDGPLFSGHLASMRTKGEFRQGVGDVGTLHKACKRALDSYKHGKVSAAQITEFRDHACNALALFFIARAGDLQSQSKSIEYHAFRQLVEDWMAEFFLDGLQRKILRETDAWVYVAEPLNTAEGCSAGDSPAQKAAGLLKCEGRLIRIWTGTHFFAGEVRDGVLHAWDNQGDSKHRSGTFDLRNIKPGSDTYVYLTKVLHSASPEAAGALKARAEQKRVSQTRQPGASPDASQTDDDCTCDDA